MGKIRTAKRNIIKKRSKKLHGGSAGADAGAAGADGVVDKEELNYDDVFEVILKEYEYKFSDTVSKSYSIKPDDCSFFKGEGVKEIKYKNTILENNNYNFNPTERKEIKADKFKNIEDLVEDTHTKLAQWNKCLEDTTDESPPEENVSTGGINTKPEKLLLCAYYHGAVDTTKLTRVPDNIVVCLLTRAGQYGWSFKNDYKQYISLAKQDKSFFENLFTEKIKKTTESKKNVHGNDHNFSFLNDCFQYSSWYYPGQVINNLSLSLKGEDEDVYYIPWGVHFINPQGELPEDKIFDRMEYEQHGQSYSFGSRYFFRGGDTLRINSLDGLMTSMNIKFSDKKIMLIVECCRALYKTKETEDFFYRDFYTQLVNHYFIDNNIRNSKDTSESTSTIFPKKALKKTFMEYESKFISKIRENKAQGANEKAKRKKELEDRKLIYDNLFPKGELPEGELPEGELPDYKSSKIEKMSTEDKTKIRTGFFSFGIDTKHIQIIFDYKGIPIAWKNHWEVLLGNIFDKEIDTINENMYLQPDAIYYLLIDSDYKPDKLNAQDKARDLENLIKDSPYIYDKFYKHIQNNISILEEEITEVEGFKSLEDYKKLHTEVTKLNEKLKEIQEKFRIEKHTFDRDLEIYDENISNYLKYSKERINKHYQALEKLKKLIISNIADYLEGDSESSETTSFREDYETNKYSKDLEDDYKKMNFKNFLCSQTITKTSHDFNEHDIISYTKTFNPLVSIFTIKFFNFIKDVENGKLNMIDASDYIISNLKTTSIGKFCMVLDYLNQNTEEIETIRALDYGASDNLEEQLFICEQQASNRNLYIVENYDLKPKIIPRRGAQRPYASTAPAENSLESFIKKYKETEYKLEELSLENLKNNLLLEIIKYRINTHGYTLKETEKNIENQLTQLEELEPIEKNRFQSIYDKYNKLKENFDNPVSLVGPKFIYKRILLDLKKNIKTIIDLGTLKRYIELHRNEKFNLLDFNLVLNKKILQLLKIFNILDLEDYNDKNINNYLEIIISNTEILNTVKELKENISYNKLSLLIDYDEKSMPELIKKPNLSYLKIKGEGYETLLNSEGISIKSLEFYPYRGDIDLSKFTKLENLFLYFDSYEGQELELSFKNNLTLLKIKDLNANDITIINNNKNCSELEIVDSNIKNIKIKDEEDSLINKILLRDIINIDISFINTLQNLTHLKLFNVNLSDNIKLPTSLEKLELNDVEFNLDDGVKLNFDIEKCVKLTYLEILNCEDYLLSIPKIVEYTSLNKEKVSIIYHIDGDLQNEIIRKEIKKIKDTGLTENLNFKLSFVSLSPDLFVLLNNKLNPSDKKIDLNLFETIKEAQRYSDVCSNVSEDISTEDPPPPICRKNKPTL